MGHGEYRIGQEAFRFDEFVKFGNSSPFGFKFVPVFPGFGRHAGRRGYSENGNVAGSAHIGQPGHQKAARLEAPRVHVQNALCWQRFLLDPVRQVHGGAVKSRQAVQHALVQGFQARIVFLFTRFGGGVKGNGFQTSILSVLEMQGEEKASNRFFRLVGSVQPCTAQVGVCFRPFQGFAGFQGIQKLGFLQTCFQGAVKRRGGAAGSCIKHSHVAIAIGQFHGIDRAGMEVVLQ